MAKNKIKVWILHAGIEHPSPYFYNFCFELNTYENYEYIVNPELPLKEKIDKGIIYFNRLKRFYNNDNIETANEFLNNIDYLKQKGWKIVWTLHNFFPIDRKINYVDEYVTSEFIKKCDLVFTLSEYMKKSVKEHFDINAINHGIGINKLNNNYINPKIKEIKKSNEFTFTFIGNIYKYRMLDQVIKSFDKMKDCRLIIAGREAKNANVNINYLIGNNKNIIYINAFVDENDWKELARVTDAFVSLYDLRFPAFKYGFFPSNYINIAKTGIRCISPRSDIIEEMISKEQLITYDFDDKNGLYNAMLKAKSSVSNKVNVDQKYNYSWKETVDKFVNSCNKLF